MWRGIRTLLVVAGTLATLLTAVAWQATPPRTPGRLPALREAAPRWYRGNLHTHSLWSDGDDFPEMIADWYRRHGYDFLALTDHNVLAEGDRWVPATAGKGAPSAALEKYLDRFGSAWVERREVKGQAQVRLKPLAEFRSLLEEPGKFLLVPGEEITTSYAKAPVHINAINLRDVLKPSVGTSVLETIRVNHRQIAEQQKKTGRKLLAFLNHPNFVWGVRAEEMIEADELGFFEVFNGHPSVNNEGDATRPGTERLWDLTLALRLGRHKLGLVYGLATDDAHNYHVTATGKANPGRGWVMVRAPYLSAEALVTAIHRGDFYASSGVVLDEVASSGGELRLRIRAEPGVTYTTEFIATARDASLDSKPRADKDGKPLPVTRVYSPDIGRVVLTTTDLAPRYPLTGKEWYVRARVRSSKPHPNPCRKGDVEMAWTQPVVPAEGGGR